MTLNLRMPDKQDLRPRITVFGVGGAGGNAVNNMIDKALEGAVFVVANTDAQALTQTKAPNKIQMGVKLTEGLGAGAKPEIGAAAAEESIEDIVDHLTGSHMCFITAGMGGGTGTGAAPIIAQAARELGVLTVGVVTKPFQFEGAKRMRQAEEGVEALQKVVDTLIIIPNQNLFRIANEKTTFTEAFSMADDVLYQGVKGVTDLMVRPGLINLDFADVRAVMDEMGKAMMGTGEAEGEDRAIQAAEKAIANPLLDEISLKGARGVLINITGGHDLTLFELDEAANRIREEVDAEANIIVGSTLDPEMEGIMRVSVVATGIDVSEMTRSEPAPRRRMAEPLKAARQAAAEAGYEDEYEDQDIPENAQPSLLDEMEPDSAFDRFEREMSLFDDTPESDATAGQGDDLPPPVYTPETPAAAEPPSTGETRAARGDVSGAEPDVTGFVAPKPHAPQANPSPEAIARLRAAVNKQPREASQTVPRPAQAQAARARPERGSRFGINTLINRMTGHGADHDNAAQAARVTPPVGEAPDEAVDPEQERIDIPAFLRRQAN